MVSVEGGDGEAVEKSKRIDRLQNSYFVERRASKGIWGERDFFDGKFLEKKKLAKVVKRVGRQVEVGKRPKTRMEKKLEIGEMGNFVATQRQSFQVWSEGEPSKRSKEVER